MTRTKSTYLAIFVVLLSPMAANADPILIIDVDGQLLGVTDINVRGTLYDVMFLDGTCVELFSGCDENSDFLFTRDFGFGFVSEEVTAEALQILLDQVFVDGPLGQFDTNPSLTAGCTSIGGGCGIVSPFALRVAVPGTFNGIVADNDVTSKSNNAYNSTISLDLRNHDDLVYAVWTRSVSVPEPGTLALLGIGPAAPSRPTGYC